MLRKVIAVILIFFNAMSIAFAFRIYVKPSLSYLSTTDDSDSTATTSMAYGPGIAAGLGNVFYKYFYAGIEGFWIPNTLPVNSDSGSVYKISYQYGISLLPGVSFDNTVIGYLRLGVLRSNFPNASAQVSANQIGVGLEYSLSQNWGVNGEYNSERYKGSTAVGTATTGKYTIGVLYKFNL